MKKIFVTLFLLALFTIAQEDCRTKLFTIQSAPGITIGEYINNLADECGFTVLVKDRYAKRKLHSPLGRLNLKNVTLTDLLHILLDEHNLNYTLDGNLLKIRYLITKTFRLDYIITKRKSETTTDASVDVSVGGNNGNGQTTRQGRDINKIQATDEFDFWSKIPKEIAHIINRPEDEYKAPPPIVNANAGLITVTATKKQIDRVQSYIENIENRLHKEVLIDVSILAVVLSKNATTGIDWSRFNLLLNGNYDGSGKFVPTNPLYQYQSVGTGTNFKNLSYTSTATAIINTSLHLAGIINFLQQNGNVITLSNPKVLTLNNQPAIITIGDTFNYNVPTQITISSNNNPGEVAYTPSSIFVGILLNITPEITKDNDIILRINPSISELRNPEELDKMNQKGFREIAPDTTEKKISTVVKVKNGATLILGGLISNTKNFMINGVPILKDIPIFGNLFKSKKSDNKRFELVFILRPRIVDGDTSSLSLKDFGYKKLPNEK